MSEDRELEDTESHWKSNGLYRSKEGDNHVVLVKDGRWAISKDEGETAFYTGGVDLGFLKSVWEKVQ